MSTTEASSSSHPSGTDLTSTSSPITSNAREVAEARAALQASMHNIGARLDADLQSRASTLHTNARALDKQEAQLATATAGLRKETAKLTRVAADAQRRVKELGNVQNWAEVLEREFLVLEEMMRAVEGGEEVSLSSSYCSDDDDDNGDGWEPCRVCGVPGEEEDVLLCDGWREGRRCDAPFHLGCLGLGERPVGDWVCGECKRGLAGVRRGGVLSAGVGEGGFDMGGLREVVVLLQRGDGTWSSS